MNWITGLAQVPAWFWIALGTILALAGLVAGVIWSRHTRYRPEHRAPARQVLADPVEGHWADMAEQPFYGSMNLADERPLTAYELGIPPSPDLAWREMVALGDELAHEPTAAEVARSRAAHGYIPELDPDVDDEEPDHDRCISCGAEIDHYLGCPDDPAPDYEAEAELPERLCGPEQPPEKPAGTESAGSGHSDGGGGVPGSAHEPVWPTLPPRPPTRLADTGDVMDARLAADVAADIRRRDADTAAWLAELESGCRAYLRELAAAL